MKKKSNTKIEEKCECWDNGKYTVLTCMKHIMQYLDSQIKNKKKNVKLDTRRRRI